MFWWHNWIHNFSNLSWVLCKNWMKPKMEESVLGFCMHFTCLNWIGDRCIRRPKCGLSTYSAPCLGFFCAILKKGEYMIRAIWEYIRERKWRYEDRYGPDSLWLHLIDPDASHPALSGSFEPADADAIQLCMGYGPLGRIQLSSIT